jgi:CarD family transcriptional regulator
MKSEKPSAPVKAVETVKTRSPAPKAKAVPVVAPQATPSKKVTAAKGAEPKATTAPDVKVIAKAVDAAPKATAADAPAKKQAAKPASAAPEKAVAAKPAAEKAAQPQTTVVKAPAPVQAAPAPTKAPASPAPAAQVVSSAPKPASKSSQTQVGTVNLKKPQTANDSAPISSPTPAPAAAAKPAAKPGQHRTGFKSGEHIVYPAHGVGQIVAVEEQEVAGFKLELFVISFAKDKMTLKVPMPKVIAGAIRKLADAATVQKALDTLTGRARIKRTMWSRRAQEYEAKINSGDLGSIAEVVRDLYRSEAQPEQSYSERQLYESALDRMAREIAVVQKLTDSESLRLIESHLQKGPKRGSKAEQAAEDLAEDAAAEIEEAA